MEDGEWYASIPGFPGLWATGPTIEDTRAHLRETLEDWIPVHTRIGKNRLPTVDGIDPYAMPPRVPITD
jgi:predicted RNase H-like HicB family nuclease